MSVPISGAAIGAPTPLFHIASSLLNRFEPELWHDYEAAADGSRFLVLRNERNSAPPPFIARAGTR